MNEDKRIKNESGAKSFMSGVLVLSLSTLIVKVIGLAFKIPMLSFLGAEGMGYFNSAYEIYALLCVVSTAGLPVALSMLVSSARARGDLTAIKKIFKTAKRLFFIMGAAGMAAMLLFASSLAEFIGNSEAYFSILAIAPALFFICLASAVRGYCQGFGDMLPTALSQLIEALAKLGLGVLFAIIAIRRGYGVPIVSAFAVLGITVGTLLSLLYLSFAQIKHTRSLSALKSGEERCVKSSALKSLSKIAFPITLGSLVMGLTRIIDMTLIMRRLQDIGVSAAESNKIYGAYTTLAVPVFGLIPALITPISMALVPSLTAALERNDISEQRGISENAMRLTTVFAIPASLGLAVFSRQILGLLFYGQSEAIEISAPLLSVLGISVVFSCLITTTNAILQSYQRVMLPIISMSVGVLVKFAVSYLLIGERSVGAMGAPIGSLWCGIVVSALNIWFMRREAGEIFSAKRVFFKPLAASALSIGGAVAAYIPLCQWISGVFSLMISVAVAVLLYLGISFCIGSMTVDDLALIPGLNRFLTKRITKNKRE